MKKRSHRLLLFMVLLSVILPKEVLSYDSCNPTMTWNTFLGSGNDDQTSHIAFDNEGNLYVTGLSTASWGSPISPFAGVRDAFVAKLDKNGTLLWNTFLGSGSLDYGQGIAVDPDGKIYVTGISLASWGNNILNPHAGGLDVFVAQLDENGIYQWNTFYGSAYDDYAYVLAFDGANLYISGYCQGGWGNPIHGHSGGWDAFILKLEKNGAYRWHTFLGSGATDQGYGITVDVPENVYLTGESYASWGNPIHPHAGGVDGFIAKLNQDGILQWNTFLGSGSLDVSYGIALDPNNNLYLTGFSLGTWGPPINQHTSGSADIFVAKYNNNGIHQWNTFMGSSGLDYGYEIISDGNGSVYVTGFSEGSFGHPCVPFAGGLDAFVARLAADGTLEWNTFLGSAGYDVGTEIAFDNSGKLYVGGDSSGGWCEDPIRAHSGGYDAFVAQFNFCQKVIDLSARAKSDKVQLTWTHVGSDCYNVYRSLRSGGPYEKIADCLVTDYSTYLDVNMVNGTTYYYMVKSVCSGIESDASNEASATPTDRIRR